MRSQGVHLSRASKGPLKIKPWTSATPAGSLQPCCLGRSNKLPTQTPPNLLLEHFFDLSDLFLYLADVFLGVAFGL